MSVVTFKPAEGDDIVALGVWPDNLIDTTEGGIIELEFWGSRTVGEPATYRDRFGETYEVVRLPDGQLVAEIRED